MENVLLSSYSRTLSCRRDVICSLISPILRLTISNKIPLATIHNIARSHQSIWLKRLVAFKIFGYGGLRRLLALPRQLFCLWNHDVTVVLNFDVIQLDRICFKHCSFTSGFISKVGLSATRYLVNDFFHFSFKSRRVLR